MQPAALSNEFLCNQCCPPRSFSTIKGLKGHNTKVHHKRALLSSDDRLLTSQILAPHGLVQDKFASMSRMSLGANRTATAGCLDCGSRKVSCQSRYCLRCTVDHQQETGIVVEASEQNRNCVMMESSRRGSLAAGRMSEWQQVLALQQDTLLDSNQLGLGYPGS